MVHGKSHGPRRGTRKRFRRSERVSVNRFIKQFNIGDKIVIVIDSASSKGMPFKRFQGLAGKIIEKRGKAYLVEIKDGNKIKKITACSEHLKAA
jgi:large subunit ribosomal protein L21e